MARRKTQSTRGRKKETHPGSSVEDARSVGGKDDFGAPESNVVERSYVSTNTKRSDPGAALPRAGGDGSRTAGVGGLNAGPGSYSGGDLDPEIIGLGTGGGVAMSGKIHEPPGPDDVEPTGPKIAPGARSSPQNPKSPPHLGPGTTVQPPDDSTVGSFGADAASRPEAGDDAFAGEITSDEATGRNDAGD